MVVSKLAVKMSVKSADKGALKCTKLALNFRVNAALSVIAVILRDIHATGKQKFIFGAEILSPFKP